MKPRPVGVMPCFSPLKAIRDPEGRVHFRKGGPGLVSLELPCGQCVGCRAERARQWALRCVHEAQMHRANCFLTLTYSNEGLPAGGSLRLEDWQKFARRVRKSVGPFRFLHCGEYGSENYRPHYHACVFGLDFSADRYVYKIHRGNTLWRSPTLESLWPLGFATIGALSFESAAYVARYVMKKATGALAERRYSRLDPVTGEVWMVKPEYVTMSRRPGLGATWFEKYRSDVFPADEVVHEGRRFRPPRFYSSKLPEKELEEMKVKRRRLVEKRKEELTPERLLVRERSAVARLRLHQREL